MSNTRKIFQYSAVFYFILALLFAVLVDRKGATLSHLNFLKGIESRLFDLKIKSETPSTLELKEGVHFYHKMARIMPEDGVLRGNIGYCYFYLKDYKSALSYYEKAVRLAPALYTVYSDLGTVYLVLGDKAQAQIHFQKALSLLPLMKTYYKMLSERLKEPKGLVVLSRLIQQAALDQQGLIEKLKENSETIHNKVENKKEEEQMKALHFFTVEESGFFKGLVYVAGR